MAIGNKGALSLHAYGIESSYGTPVAVDQWPGLMQDFTDDSEFHIEAIRGGGTFEPAQVINLEFNAKGSLDVIPQDGRLLSFGFNAGSTVSGSQMDHQMAISGIGAFRSATFEVDQRGGAVGMTKTIAGVKFSKLSLTTDSRDMLHIKGDWVGKFVSGIALNATSVTASTAAPYIYAGGNLTFNGTTFAEMKNVEVNLMTALSPDDGFYITSGATPTLTDLNESNVSTEASATMVFTTPELYQRFLGWSGASVPQLTGSLFNAVMIWRKTATDFIQITLSGCRFSSDKIDGNTKDVLSQKLAITATNRIAQVRDLNSGTNFYF